MTFLRMLAFFVLVGPGAAAAQDRFESTMGFATQYRDYGALALDDDLPSALAARSPYDGTAFGGLRYEARLVVSHVRMTAGFDALFALASPPDVTLGDGTNARVGSLYGLDGRFALGLEHAIAEPLSLYLDLVGTLHVPHTSVNIDGETHDATRVAFGFGARLGARFSITEDFFVVASAEVGFVGPFYAGGELAVGFAVN